MDVLNRRIDEEDSYRTVPTNYEETVRQLDTYYGIVKRQLLRYQNPITGLFPVLSSHHKIGSVRDSVYCAAAIWGLHQAYRRIDDDRGKSHELGQSAVKCMRGILSCWIRQADRVEKFKRRQCEAHALHVKFDLNTGGEILKDHEYHHLQIDAVSLYLIFLVQMITSGLQVIYTQDEVAFIQNLVYYVERAYRTPDYGMWERGSKHNDGTPEIHASSIGIAKSALEAINGCNLFGDQGASWSVIYVDIDAHNRNRSIFETLLPRESSSKGADASLLSTISFPAYATHDKHLYTQTKMEVIETLQGQHGFKRFMRDGFGNPSEDRTKRYYKRDDLVKFEGCEPEWPLFFLYMIIDGVFGNMPEQIREYQDLLTPRLQIDQHGDPVVPWYYIKNGDGTWEPCPEPGLFLWGQALFIIAQLLTAGLLHAGELDPIRRHLPSYSRPRRAGIRYSAFQGTATDLVVQIVLIAESMRLQAMMATYGIQTQTPHEVEPVQIWSSTQLVRVYEQLGVDSKLGLQGRPARPVGSLGTSKVYRVGGTTVLCYPLIFEVSEFYLYRDMALLIDDIKTELQFVGRYWRLSGRPTVCLLIREEHMRDPHFKHMLDLLASLKKGRCEGVKVRVGRLQNLISSSCIEHLDFASADEEIPSDGQFHQLEHDYIGYQSLTDVPRALKYSDDDRRSGLAALFESKPLEDVIDIARKSEGVYARCQLWGVVLQRQGPKFQLPEGGTIEQKMRALYIEAGSIRHWAAVRHASSLLRHTVDSISPFITAVLVHGKQLTVGVVGHEETAFDKPMTPAEIQAVMYKTVQPHNVIQAVLQQEVVLYCGRLIATNPDLFRGILNIRVGWVLEAMKMCQSDNTRTVDEFSPYEVRRLLHRALSSQSKFSDLQKRRIEGCLCRVPTTEFYNHVWDVMARCPFGVLFMGQDFPRYDTLARSDLSFALLVEQILNRMLEPERRHLVVELLCVVSTVLDRNPELTFGHELHLEKLLEHAAYIYVKDHEKDRTVKPVDALCAAPRALATGCIARAVVDNLLQGAHLEHQSTCRIS